MHPFDAIRWQALRDVWFDRDDKDGGDPGYFLRKVHRWYSRNLNTPLHLVYDLPTEDVLQAYYETLYEDMTDEEMETHIKDHAVSDEELERRKQKSQVLDSFDEELIREAQAQNAAHAVKTLEEALKPAQDAFKKMLAQARGPGKESSLVPTTPKSKSKPLTDTDGFKMQFISDEELAELENTDPFRLFPGKKIKPQ